jgi:hypothetical protein
MQVEVSMTSCELNRLTIVKEVISRHITQKRRHSVQAARDTGTRIREN